MSVVGAAHRPRSSSRPLGAPAHGSPRRLVPLWAWPVALVAAVGLSAASIFAPPARATLAYVPNWGDWTVSVIDANTYQLVDTFEDVGHEPYTIATLPDRNKAYVGSYSQPEVTVLDIEEESPAFGAVLARIRLSSERLILAQDVEATRDGSRIYVAAYRSVFVVDTASDSVIAEVTGLDSAKDLTITPDDREVYVGDYYGDSVTVIRNAADPAEIEVTDEIYMDDGRGGYINPMRLIASADGSTVWVSDVYSPLILIVDTATKRIVRRRPLAGPGEMAFTPDGGYAFVAQILPFNLLKMRTDNYLIESRAPLTHRPWPAALDMTSDGHRLFYADYTGGSIYGDDLPGWILVIDADRNRLIKSIRVGRNPADIDVAD